MAGIYVGNYGTSTNWPSFDSFQVQQSTTAPPPPTSTATWTATPTSSVATATPWPTGVSDNFNRPDNVTLGQASPSNQAWLTDGSTWGICSQRACNKGPSNSGNYARIDAQKASGTLTVDVPARPSANGQAGVFMNMTADWQTMTFVGLDVNGTIEIWTLDPTNGWQEPTTVPTTQSSAAARSMTVTYNAGSLSVAVGPTGGSQTTYISGLNLSSVYDPSGTNVGIYADTVDDASSSNWAQYDNFAFN
jgi:hypothetical protein